MQVAIVTGATQGIGKAIAVKLAELNYRLVLVGRNKQRLENTQALFSEQGAEVLCLSADLEQPESFKRIVDQTIERYGQLDVLINNAGFASSLSIEETDIESWDRIHAVNARAPFFLTKEALPYLKKSQNAFIINIASVVGFKGYVNQAAYASSKHALSGFTKVLAKEVQADGIRVHLISPGGVKTEMVEEMRPDLDMDQLILPEEVAELVEFILTRKGRGTIDHFYIRRESGLAFE